jgi:hypothetical protein
MRRVLLPILVVASASLASCSTQAEDVLAPEFEAGQGQPKAGASLYPVGPYGIGEGSTLPDWDFEGFPDPALAHDANAMQTIHLADFFDPHADDTSYAPVDAAHDDRLFPPGSPYGAGKPKPKALLLDISSVWCPSCSQESKLVLPAKHAKYRPCGGEFLLQLADGPTPGMPATGKNLQNWTTTFAVDYPSVLDPSRRLAALVSSEGYPSNVIVDTRSMKVVKTIAGEPDDAFWASFEATMGAPACLAGP